MRIPMHLGRGPDEGADSALVAFYDRLLACLSRPAFRDGEWQLLDARPAWEGNGSNDDFICYAWTGPADEHWLVAVNFADEHSQSYVSLPWDDLASGQWLLTDAMGDELYERDGEDLAHRGLYLELGPWAYNVFEFKLDTRGPGV